MLCRMGCKTLTLSLGKVRSSVVLGREGHLTATSDPLEQAPTFTMKMAVAIGVCVCVCALFSND